MNWLQKFAVPIKTQDLPRLLAQAIEYECGGNWEASDVRKWTEALDKITGTQLGQEMGYSTSFLVTCKEGDGQFGQKWGVSVNFTVTSGQSDTTFDSETGDWDLAIAASVQWASPKSWTPMTPYPLMIRPAGARDGMETIQEVASFVKEAIWNDQRDDEDDDDEFDVEPEPETPPGVEQPVPSGVLV